MILIFLLISKLIQDLVSIPSSQPPKVLYLKVSKCVAAFSLLIVTYISWKCYKVLLCCHVLQRWKKIVHVSMTEIQGNE